MDELKQAAQLFAEALFIRAKYMSMSQQSFCTLTARALNTIHDGDKVEIPDPPVTTGKQTKSISCWSFRIFSGRLCNCLSYFMTARITFTCILYHRPVHTYDLYHTHIIS